MKKGFIDVGDAPGLGVNEKAKAHLTDEDRGFFD
jgi:hypothetical protein